MKRLIMCVLVLMIAMGTMLSAEEKDDFNFGLSEVIIEKNLHRIGGYTTLGLLAATGTAGFTGWEGHPYLGYSTLGSAALSSIMGTIAYKDLLPVIWPHVLFNSVGITGLVLNTFILEPGSLEHKVSGAAAMSSFAAGYVSIIIITR